MICRDAIRSRIAAASGRAVPGVSVLPIAQLDQALARAQILVCLLPALAVVGCAITLWLALSLPIHEVAAVDRFGHVLERSERAP